MVEKLSVLKNTSEISNDWVPIKKWMSIFKIFIVLGIVIFTIGQFAMVSDTDLAAYIWFSIGLIATWVITLRIIANKKGETVGILSTFNNLSQFLPTLGVMVPLAILIYVLIKTRPILQSNMENLPKQFFWFNRLSFFLIIFQLFLLNNFYESSLKDNSYNGIWIAAMILFSIITSASAIELYVIITSFLTDG
jgi:hypothetical protein